MNKITQREWDRSVGYGAVPEDKKIPDISDEHWNGEQRLNQSTGEVEVWYNGDWCAR
jgi:hypothetical protein